MNHPAAIAALLVGSYLFGSLPFGLYVARQWKGIDIRTVGSGNIGATNVGRNCGPAAFVVVFLLDLLKGLLPPLIARLLHLESSWQVFAGLAGIIGHNFSIFLGFKGGKGISTGLGTLIGLVPWCALIAAGLFLSELLTLRYVSLGSMLAAISVPLLIPVIYPHEPALLLFGILGSAVIIIKHLSNVKRILKGQEPRVNLFRKQVTEPPAESSE